MPAVAVLRRPRLTALLTEAAAKRVTLVCGPAGAGKTVACAHWAAAQPAGTPVAWLSLDPGDHDPDRLWAHLGAAIANAPGVPAEVAAELRTAGRPRPANASQVAATEFPLRLVEAAERFAHPVTVVLDDIQLLTDSAAMPGLDFLIRHAPPSLRLLLTGRHQGGLPVGRLRVGGDLAEISGSDLACTRAEADEYLALAGAVLSPAQRDDLISSTEGWITGLRLAVLAAGARSGQPAGPTVAPLAGTDPAVADYLWDEVLAPLPPARRRFLLRTSVTQQLCGPLADAITGESGSAKLLDQLCRENLMIELVPGTEQAEPGDGDREHGPGPARYRYHPLLRDLLRAQLASELPGEPPALARRAAGWLAGQGRAAEAIACATQAGDLEVAARVLASAGPLALLTGNARDFDAALALFPVGLEAASPAIRLTRAASALRRGEWDPAAGLLQGAGSGPAPQTLRLLLDVAAGGLDCGLPERSRELAGRWEATPPPGADRNRASLEQASPEQASPESVGPLWLAIGIAELVAGRVDRALESLARARVRLARGWLALALAMTGDYAASAGLATGLAAGVAEPWPASGATAGASPEPLAARPAELAQALACWARDDLPGARRLLDSGTDAESPLTRALTIRLATLIRVRVALADGEFALARAEAAQLRRPHPEAASAGLAAGLEAEIALREGDPRRARLALPAPPGLADPAGQLRQAPIPAGIAVLLARTQLAEGDSAGTIATLGCYLGGACDEPGKTLFPDIEVSVLITAAVANRRLGRSQLAAGQLARALEIAELHGNCRAFLDGGPAARSALTLLTRPAGPGSALAARILQRFDTRQVRLADQPAAATVPLTSSELAVLRFLPSHMTNQEIAEALFLSINTVKTHLRSVYRKLGVTTRRQAIAQADRAGLV